MGPAYKKDDFIHACKTRKVILWAGVETKAYNDFTILGKNAILDCILNSLKDEHYEGRSYPLSKDTWFHKSKPPMIDPYIMKIDTRKTAFVAFYWDHESTKWILKSFHKPNPNNPKNPLSQNLGDALDEAIRESKTEKEEK